MLFDQMAATSLCQPPLLGPLYLYTRGPRCRLLPAVFRLVSLTLRLSQCHWRNSDGYSRTTFIDDTGTWRTSMFSNITICSCLRHARNSTWRKHIRMTSHCITLQNTVWYVNNMSIFAHKLQRKILFFEVKISSPYFPSVASSLNIWLS